MEGVTTLDGYTPDVATGHEFTIDGTAVPFYSRWELLESIDSSPFLGAFQDEVDFTTTCRQASLCRDQFIFYRRDRRVDEYSTVEDHTLSSEGLVTVADEPPSTLTPSLQSSQEPPKKPGRKRKTQHSKRAAPKSGRRNSRRDNNGDPRRKGIDTHANGVGPSSGTSNYKQDAKYKRQQERNRIAANKFRKRKREDLARLESDEQDIEQHHRTLSSCVDDLNEEILRLKMQLLQHTSCNCTLIQHYNKIEAQHYIQQQYGDGYPQAEHPYLHSIFSILY